MGGFVVVVVVPDFFEQKTIGTMQVITSRKDMRRNKEIYINAYICMHTCGCILDFLVVRH